MERASRKPHPTLGNFFEKMTFSMKILIIFLLKNCVFKIHFVFLEIFTNLIKFFWPLPTPIVFLILYLSPIIFDKLYVCYQLYKKSALNCYTYILMRLSLCTRCFSKFEVKILFKSKTPMLSVTKNVHDENILVREIKTYFTDCFILNWSNAKLGITSSS